MQTVFFARIAEIVDLYAHQYVLSPASGCRSVTLNLAGRTSEEKEVIGKILECTRASRRFGAGEVFKLISSSK